MRCTFDDPPTASNARSSTRATGAESGDSRVLTDAERTELDALFLVHDEWLAAVPVHRYLEALEQAGRHGAER
ncbi:hypothetical protein B7G54_16220 [Burkholderia puraquae]|uniref:Uncharacterized protein n=1 Tax=Burkholderia puraquae TaxID=1904757 RepID=A0A1X1PGI7_9BURK|nr:hypothetical protein B7G54_16220 [Burkholderia puraquae]